MSRARRHLTPLAPLVEAIESTDAFDRPAQAAAKRFRASVKPGRVKDALGGTPVGHAIHPLLTDVVIGSFTSATLLDLLGGDRDGTAARRLIGVGIAAYGPTALTGVHDWADSEPGNDAVRRSGLAHAVTNGAALALYAASLAARRRGNDRHGKLLGLLGAGALGAGGYLGGHLVFAKGIGPDQTTFDAGPADWTDAAGEDEVSPEMPTRVIVGDTPVLLVEHEGALRAIHDRCSHRGCSLADGSVESGEVVCPCHGSRFRLEDGGLVRGPATTPQPAFDVRRRDGRIELRLAQAD